MIIKMKQKFSSHVKGFSSKFMCETQKIPLIDNNEIRSRKYFRHMSKILMVSSCVKTKKIRASMKS